MDMTLEESILAEHKRWFGRKCKVKNPRTFNTSPDRVYTITEVSVITFFSKTGQPHMVQVGTMFFESEDGRRHYTGRYDLDLTFLD